MADPSLLASIISGTNPLAPQMLGAYQGAQLSSAGLDPNFGHNEGPFGALGKIIAAARGGPMLQQGVEATTAGNMAAMPDLAKLLASPDPYTALAGNVPGTNPVAAARLLNATPEDVAKTRLANMQMGLIGAKINQANQPGTRLPLFSPTTTGAAGAGSNNAPGTSFTAITGASARPATDADLVPILALPDAQAAAKLAQIKATNPKLWALYQSKVRGAGNATAKP